jgi:hypothetical protein
MDFGRALSKQLANKFLQWSKTGNFHQSSAKLAQIFTSHFYYPHGENHQKMCNFDHIW